MAGQHTTATTHERQAGGVHTPLLLFGMPRSGTTWIGKLLDSHPDTLYRHEPDSWQRLDGMPLLPAPDDAYQYDALVTAYVERIPGMHVNKVCARVPLFPKTYQSALRLQVVRAGVLLAKFGGRRFADFPVLGVLDGARYTGLRLVWKSIESLGRLATIMAILEHARAIHLLRHPCGHVASVLRGEAERKFSGSCGASADYGMFALLSETPQARRRGLDLAQFRALTPTQRLAWRWVLVNEKAMEECAELGRVRVVRYEDVCKDPLATLKDLFDFLGLPWHEQTQRFIDSSTSGENKAYYSLFKNPARAANKWKDELPTESIDAIMAIAADSAPGKLYLGSSE